jgi:hypothetical protein
VRVADPPGRFEVEDFARSLASAFFSPSPSALFLSCSQRLAVISRKTPNISHLCHSPSPPPGRGWVGSGGEVRYKEGAPRSAPYGPPSSSESRRSPPVPLSRPTKISSAAGWKCRPECYRADALHGREKAAWGREVLLSRGAPLLASPLIQPPPAQGGGTHPPGRETPLS